MKETSFVANEFTALITCVSLVSYLCQSAHKAGFILHCLQLPNALTSSSALYQTPAEIPSFPSQCQTSAVIISTSTKKSYTNYHKFCPTLLIQKENTANESA